MSRQPLPEVVHDVTPHPLITTESRDGSGKDGSDAMGGEAAIAIAPVRKDEPVVTRKVCACLFVPLHV